MYVVIFGATSTIAHATARLYAAEKATMLLVGRNEEELQRNAADLTAFGAAAIETYCCDFTDRQQQGALLEKLAAGMAIDVALLAWGTLPSQDELEGDVAATMRALDINGMSYVALLAGLAPIMARAQSGTIGVITSVAGDRGRYSNYTYGAAKAAVATYTAGLRARLHHHGVAVVTIKPGFVDTPMTAGFKKGALWAKPEGVATSIKKAISNKRNSIYVPWFWAVIMTIIQHIPEKISRKLKY